MSAGRSREDLLKFIDYLSSKGLIPGATANARKASTNKVLAILGEEEAADVLSLDIDHVMQRFSNLNGQQYTPKSLSDYRSRLRSSIDDFRSYVDNPLGFRPGGRNRTKPTEGKTSPSNAKKQKISPSAPSQSTLQEQPAPTASVDILPIHLRSDLVVRVAGLPYDLTQAEARKIANIILAHALGD